MKVTLLGTGSADGWPNPWCDCASCAWAREHEVRGQTAVLIDDALLIDCGPDVPRTAARLGVRLSGLRHLLISHAHPDHLGPESLMWRSWSTAAGRPLDVVGPPAALAACREFLARWERSDPDRDGSPLRLIAVVPGGTPTTPGPLRLGADDRQAAEDRGSPEDQESPSDRGYLVRPVAAQHGDASIGPAVLYDVTAPDGGRLLYGCDTAAPLPAETLEAVTGRAYDVVLLEENNGDRPGFGEHLDLDTFGQLVAELRRRGAVVPSTLVLAVHLSHRNPPGDELARRLHLVGALAPADGTVYDIVPAARRQPSQPSQPSQPPRAPGRWQSPVLPAPHRVLITGGARSGKSAEAERRLLAEPEVVYVATSAPPDPADAEWSERIAAHRRRRPAAWTTVETVDLVPLLRSPGPPLLIDGLGLWVGAWLDRPDELRIRAEELVDAWRATGRRVVAVTDEVGSGVVPPAEAGRRFRDVLGRLNADLAAEADEVWQVVAGIPLRLRPFPHERS
ncbi:adenosylcobinamide-phosphate guanylyltransferase [Frankia casuarinae]|uniref:Adenosylcobinamide kinase n=1 Tax=Frankia casuarinae (strain DSM 45818 / CECT 9043 / HFP020203 / CcI3) TaxID=106370 RepID=Q2J8A6_FRACC|nr:MULTISPECIES: bifunctional adenosylcobinamide kinase/adenosylcobinamide-phosphate guanylyltransferase [Frankia]ABD12486.1 adenosylcobinamide kinase [Frankia casuarinae]ETA00061.1 adenosylcobinamide kinase /adenosylcobinamide-phosphate guanylyltransferase [Frankia sp. CcI6]EYT91163.1 adenosylcobinamide-phosphate guanylyltransferase [Frankia casuarinae]KDA42334.1 adenosylcobinamide-phosphate guanylyltransferase/adenosylcobinamide kinase [Frankia sp. BMG5.23]KFB04987.1 adenosylcobinamide-phosp